MNNVLTYFAMEHPVQAGPVRIGSTPQQRMLGRQLGTLVSDGRAFEVRDAPERAILLLVGAADDLGHVYRISAAGTVTDIGVTEKPA